MLVIDKYRLPLLVSLVLFCYMVLVRSNPTINNGLYVLSGVLLGMFFLDLDLLIFSIITKPDLDISKEVVSNIKRGRVLSYLRLVANRERELKDLIFHSTLFQIIVVFMAFYILIVKSNLFAQSFILSLYLNILLAQLIEYNVYGDLSRWFEFYSGKANKLFYVVYFSIIILLFVILIFI